MSLRLPQLGLEPDAPFPPAESALRDPNGLLAFGGGLEPERLLRAYAQGIFPWFSPGEPPLWWSPDPRMVLDPVQLHLSRRFRRELRQHDWQAVCDHDFEAVIEHCARLPRRGQRGTWIVPSMRRAYVRLHALGHAHSIEVRCAGRLIGGMYGLAIGRVFFGESMFSLESGTSRFAIAALCLRMRQWDMPLIDGQVESGHLESLGFRPVPRTVFLRELQELTATEAPLGDWRGAFGAVTPSEVRAL